MKPFLSSLELAPPDDVTGVWILWLVGRVVPFFGKVTPYDILLAPRRIQMARTIDYSTRLPLGLQIAEHHRHEDAFRSRFGRPEMPQGPWPLARWEVRHSSRLISGCF